MIEFLKDMADVVALLIAGVGPVAAYFLRRVKSLERGLELATQQAAGWRAVAREQRAMAEALHACVDWNTGLVSRLWSGQAEPARRVDAMKASRRLSGVVERCAFEAALFSPDDAERHDAVRALASGIGSVATIPVMAAALELYADDVELRAGMTRLSTRLAPRSPNS